MLRAGADVPIDESVYGALFERSADAVVIADDDSRILHANPVACRLLGRSIEELRGMTVAQIVREPAEQTRTLWTEFRQDGVQRGEVDLVRTDGSSVPVEYHAVTDVVPGVHASFMRDMSDRRRADEARDRFLATISHELRTPLQAILGWAGVLRHERDPEELDRGLERIELNAHAQARLVNDLLDLSRMSRGTMKLELSTVPLQEVVARAVDLVAPTAAAEEVELWAEIHPEVGSVVADPERLQQILWNLVTNAVKFTPADGRVEVRAWREEDVAVIRVRDTGIGIDPKDLGHVFDAFRQADTSRTRRRGGLGLGLAIVRHLVELHRGSVDVQSEGLGRGTTFTLRLPKGAVRAHEGDNAEPKGSEPAARPLGGIRILCCDDDPDARDVLTRSLQRRGAEVTAVGTVDEALRLLDRELPEHDVVLSDLAMPGRDGLELARSLRALPGPAAWLPLVALSAYVRDVDRESARRAGFDEHLPKPVDIDDLVRIMLHLAEGRGTRLPR